MLLLAAGSPIAFCLFLKSVRDVSDVSDSTELLELEFLTSSLGGSSSSLLATICAGGFGAMVSLRLATSTRLLFRGSEGGSGMLSGRLRSDFSPRINPQFCLRKPIVTDSRDTIALRKRNQVYPVVDPCTLRQDLHALSDLSGRRKKHSGNVARMSIRNTMPVLPLSGAFRASIQSAIRHV